MKNNDIKILEDSLDKWFNNVNLAARNIFNQNRIAKLIKKNLKKNGNWKDKPRGKENNVDNLKEKTSKITDTNILKCICGQAIIRTDKGFYKCSNDWCDKSDCEGMKKSLGK